MFFISTYIFISCIQSWRKMTVGKHSNRNNVTLWSQNEGSKKKLQNDSDEESSNLKRDEPDRALVMFRPMVSDPIYIHRKSPLPRSKKIGSVEVSAVCLTWNLSLSFCTFFPLCDLTVLYKIRIIWTLILIHLILNCCVLLGIWFVWSSFEQRRFL